jgi:hypothetical protein
MSESRTDGFVWQMRCVEQMPLNLIRGVMISDTKGAVAALQPSDAELFEQIPTFSFGK